MSPTYRLRFLFSSFGPLYLLLAMGLYFQDAAGWFWAALAFVLSFVAFLQLRSQFTRKSVSRRTITMEGSLDDNIFSYLLAYLPPILIDDYSNAAKVAPAAVFYLILAVLMFRSRTIYVNPYFILFGLRVYRVRLDRSHRSVVLVSRRGHLTNEDQLEIYEVEKAATYFAP